MPAVEAGDASSFAVVLDGTPLDADQQTLAHGFADQVQQAQASAGVRMRADEIVASRMVLKTDKGRS
jgi:hypothetical protein